MRSVDGVTWTFASTPAPAELISGAVYDGRRFVAVGSAGNVYASNDGDSWTRIGSVGNAAFLTGIAYGGGNYVAIGKSGVVARSHDGTSWTASPGVQGLDDQGKAILRDLTGVTWSGSQFVGVGPFNVRATSFDGQTWTSGPRDGLGSLAVAACDGVMVGVGNGTVESSIDGLSWHTRLWASDPELRAATCGHGRFVAVGTRGSIAVSDH